MRRIPALIRIAGGILLTAASWLAATQFGAQAQDSTHAISGQVNIHTVEKVDLNQAAAEDLIRLPGITAQLAERVIKNRPYRKLDDLVTRRILGKKEFARVRELVTVGGGYP